MTQETGEAFDHPEARAARLGAGDPRDRISLRDHVVSAEIGAFQQERGLIQRLRFNLVVELARRSPAGDDVDLILSYDRLTESIQAALADERLNLLETLAERVAARILAEPQAHRVFMRIEKLDRGPGALGIEIVRTRADNPGAAAAAAPRPVVALLRWDAPDLAALLDRLAAAGAPLILVPAAPGLPVPTSAGPAGFRIALLAIEQAAWALAARDPRLSVVATRTEIDWAARRGQPIVWAPSKLVLDTPGAPADAGDGLPLALWLAEEFAAPRLVLHGFVAPPAASRVPVEIL